MKTYQIYEDSDVLDFQDDPKFSKRFWLTFTLLMVFVGMPTAIFFIVGAITTFNWLMKLI